MADNFTAELVDSAGQIFATDQDTGDSAHYPIGKLAWGALNTFNITDSASPFPVRIWGNGSSATVHITTDSGNPPQVTLSDTVVSVTGYVAPSTNVTVSQAAGSSFQVTHPGLTALDSAINSSNELFVKVRAIDSLWQGYDTSNSALRVSVVAGGTAGPSAADDVAFSGGDSGVPVLGIASGDDVDSGDYGMPRISLGRALFTTSDSEYPTFVTNDSGERLYVRNDSNNPLWAKTVTDTANPMVVRGVGSSTVPVSGATSPYAASSVAGAVVPVTLALSSLAQTVMTATGRLYGYSVSNPDTAADVWMHIYEDDSAGVTLGTSSASINVLTPFGGGREMSAGIGVRMSSGMSAAASLSAQSTAHDAPSTTIYATFYYAPST